MSKLITAKIGGRWREVPLWATRLSFEVRPVPGFQNEAWPLWKPTLLLLDQVLDDRKWKLNWVRIHSHLGVSRSPRHSMAWVDKDTDTMMLCHFDKDTMLHEIAHLPKDDAHSDAWAKRLWELQETYLNKKDARAAHLELTRYLSGRRLYIKKFGEKPPRYVDQISIWVSTKPTSK
ncbi:hypothetical protein Rhola_00009910 [Rhodoluna lacicola]|uniref:Uncharacterized protein n=1 Tax=Rhodoluna lacicola TaxID=529884 RepID=A0A060JD40_9MICO|nr:hypothetical protein Rhola_00009910 [Rhodoluna lacicola]